MGNSFACHPRETYHRSVLDAGIQKGNQAMGSCFREDVTEKLSAKPRRVSEQSNEIHPT
jgi:hypothetical protein